jgi:glyceraldehyde 3-phosphate dehydrogenase
MKGVLEYSVDPLVSTDIIGNPHSCVFDSQFTSVIGGTLVKAFGWYDNEMGYSTRVADVAEKIMSM